MRISISGKPGSGKTTLGKKLCEKFNLKYYSIGIIQREMAKEMGITFAELAKLAESDPKYDNLFDNKIKEIAQSEDNFLIDGRLGFLFAPNTLKIFLTARDIEAGTRILNEKRDDERFQTKEQAAEHVNFIYNNLKLRYKKHYNIDFTDPAHFDLIIDTSDMQKHEVLEKTIAIVLYREGKISLGKATEIAQIDYEEMKKIITEKGIKLKTATNTKNELKERLTKFNIQT